MTPLFATNHLLPLGLLWGMVWGASIADLVSGLDLKMRSAGMQVKKT